MTRAEQIAAVLSKHQRSVARSGGPCICGSWPTGHRREGDWTEHVAAALDAALAAQEGERGEAEVDAPWLAPPLLPPLVLADPQEGEPALIHARWHHALDDPAREEPGPIRDHIQQHDAEVLRDAADDLPPERQVSKRWLRARADRIEAQS